MKLDQAVTRIDKRCGHYLLIIRVPTSTMIWAASQKPDLLEGVNAVLEDQGTERLTGFVSLRPAHQSAALPPEAAAKVSLRAAAVTLPGAAARQQFRDLFSYAQQLLPPIPRDYLFFALTERRWLHACLRDAEFKKTDAVRFYQWKHRDIPQVPQPARLRAAQESDLAALAALDAFAFGAVWHMGESDLGTLQRDCRFEIAAIDGKVVGYTALRLSQDPSSQSVASAQVVRLAVHPEVQNNGIGRQLLVACLTTAKSLGIRHVFLNTQESNTHSRRLYESLHFQKRGHSIPVFVKEGTGRLPQSHRLNSPAHGWYRECA